MNKQKNYDVIVYGATGFTGRLVAEYLAKTYPEGAPEKVTWAMAGRSLSKLEQVRNELNINHNIDLLVADSNDESAVSELVHQTKVVLTTVGPYQLYGEKLLSACVDLGKGYVDLCGEPAWMHQMINKYQDKAEQTGANVIFSCGFDSIPFDLGVLFLQQKVIQETGSPLTYVKGRVRKMQGTFSGGTAASLKATMVAAKQDKSVMQALINPFSLATGKVLADQPRGDKPYFDETLNSWAAPFIMAAINTKNVHRSNYLMGYLYGQDFQYDEMMLTGPGDKGEAIAHHVANDKSLGSDGGPKPGEGPSKEERDNGCYDVLFTGTTKEGKSYASSVAGFVDPGYGSTSRMIAESAICLSYMAKDMPGGFYTTAPAMGNELIKRLEEKADLVFKHEDI